MPWYAKPSGPYSLNSNEGIANMDEFNFLFGSFGYTPEAVAGTMGNSYAESGLNPWRWQSDKVNYKAGYGLFQFTPADSYIGPMEDVRGYAPNLSVIEITPGAEVSDADCQCICVNEDLLGKWSPYCWRSYWDKQQYNQLWQKSQSILSKYGNNSRLSIDNFKLIDNLYDATFAFLACYEGPAVPNMQTRYEYSSEIYEYITGTTPPEPPKPAKSKMPIWFYLRKF